jgi:(R,R)-butanediol dehydrogenase/meso-butanediol dehydrogenase/diacetyl reductase
MAQVAGAHHVLSPKDGDIITECRRLTGGDDRGVDVSFECAGVQATINTAIGALRTRGTCVNVAIWSIKPQVSGASSLYRKSKAGVKVDVMLRRCKF